MLTERTRANFSRGVFQHLMLTNEQRARCAWCVCVAFLHGQSVISFKVNFNFVDSNGTCLLYGVPRTTDGNGLNFIRENDLTSILSCNEFIADGFKYLSAGYRMESVSYLTLMLFLRKFNCIAQFPDIKQNSRKNRIPPRVISKFSKFQQTATIFFQQS